ncbi:MAG TPA: hypothetical protein VNL34_03985 [Candidatus Nitrosotenuis sp.]|nr:hypothetical protein [Candidatus Nitrosotenuis sp.]
MSYCIECGTDAIVCFCGPKRKIMGEYLEALKECTELKCYCKEHVPKTGGD